MNPESLDKLTRSQLAAHIDHSVLAPTASARDVQQACEEAISERFAAVCVNGVHSQLAVNLLAGSAIPVAVTIGFPLGASSTASKSFEAREALELGAKELDMVLSLGALQSGQDNFVSDELSALAQLCKPHGALLKVILETCLLQPDDLLRAIDLACQAGAHFVKTSTGFSSQGATAEHVTRMRQRAPDHVGIKAAGGIRTLADARAMLAAGATRLGCSSSMAILNELHS